MGFLDNMMGFLEDWRDWWWWAIVVIVGMSMGNALISYESAEEEYISCMWEYDIYDYVDSEWCWEQYKERKEREYQEEEERDAERRIEAQG